MKTENKTQCNATRATIEAGRLAMIRHKRDSEEMNKMLERWKKLDQKNEK